ncbi:membrane protein, exporter [Enhygromyxa salina]|uniref:Membrane protein, exporter n=1 Tax=Enhygromyxa salina TaxID=215803 RepID=A0A0C1ZXI6_9BACT|nr:membrane protein, exporter [Enhygromyxa salina]
MGIGALLLALMGLFVWQKLEVTSEITHFLAAGDDARLAKLSRQLAESELTKTTILVVDSDAGDTQAAIAAVDELADTLRELEEVAWVRVGWTEDQSDAVHDLYFPRRMYFTAGSEQALAQALAPAGLEASAQELQRQLRLPTAALIKQIAPQDPLLRYPATLERLAEARAGSLELVDGHFVTREGGAVLLFASVHSPFRAEHQGPLQAVIDARFAELNQAGDGGELGLSLRQSGVGRFALRAEAQIRGDITRISVISTLGVIALFLLLFRGPRLVLLSLVPLAAGVLTATTVSLLVFGRIHGLTLAFGASLIGVCIDYPVHLFNHHVLDPAPDGAVGSMKRIRPGLVLGALTTVAGFVGLGWASFPGVREIAVFAAVGVLGALLSTLYLLPPLMADKPKPVALQRQLAELAGRLVVAMQARRRVLLVLPLAALSLLAIALPRLEFVDDVSALTQTQADLLSEDEAVRALVSRMDAGRMIVAIGDDEEQALRKNDEVHARLLAAREAGELEAFQSLHELLWSTQLQQRNLAAYGEPAAFAERLDAAFVANGFRAGVFAPFIEALTLAREGSADGPAPLDYPTLAASTLGQAASSMRVDLDGQVGILSLVRGVDDPEALRARVADLDDVHLFDQRALMAEIYASHRVSTMQLVGVGLLAVFVLIFARYRRLGPAIAAFVPALLAAGTTVAVLVLAGYALNLMHIVSLLLVLSMGVDYGVFLAESRDRPAEVAATVSSLLACCVSTVLAFGLLAMSSNPAMQAIGLTTGIGVFASLVLAPTALILFAGGPPGAPHPRGEQS